MPAYSCDYMGLASKSTDQDDRPSKSLPTALLPTCPASHFSYLLECLLLPKPCSSHLHASQRHQSVPPSFQTKVRFLRPYFSSQYFPRMIDKKNSCCLGKKLIPRPSSECGQVLEFQQKNNYKLFKNLLATLVLFEVFSQTILHIKPQRSSPIFFEISQASPFPGLSSMMRSRSGWCDLFLSLSNLSPSRGQEDTHSLRHAQIHVSTRTNCRLSASNSTVKETFPKRNKCKESGNKPVPHGLYYQTEHSISQLKTPALRLLQFSLRTIMGGDFLYILVTEGAT